MEIYSTRDLMKSREDTRKAALLLNPGESIPWPDCPKTPRVTLARWNKSAKFVAAGVSVWWGRDKNGNKVLYREPLRA